MTTAGGEDNCTCVDTAAECKSSEGEVEGVSVGLEGSEANGLTELVVGARGGEGSEGERGSEVVVVVMSTSSRGEGLMEDKAECCSLMEEGGAADL